MNTIWKYQVPLEDTFELALPCGAEILTFQKQGDGFFVWCVVDPDVRETDVRFFQLLGTGHLFHDHIKLESVEAVQRIKRKYIGTVQSQGFVWHLFELNPCEENDGNQ